MKWKIGDICYFVENNRVIREARIVSFHGNFVQLKFGDYAGVRLNIKRIFRTEEEAKTSIRKQLKSPHL